MFRGYRLALCAAFGWLILAAPVQGTSPSRTPEGNAAAEHAVTNETTAESGVQKAPRPEIYDEGCYQSESQNNAELCAQWRAAIGAEKAAERAWWANLIGAIGAALSFASIVLVVIALGLTREANRLTKTEMEAARSEGAKLAKETASALAQSTRSADAAARAATAAEQAIESGRESNRIARQMGETQVRCYVEMESLLVSLLGDEIHLMPVFGNTGDTPARHFRWDCKAYLSPEAGEPVDPVPSYFGRSIPARQTAVFDRQIEVEGWTPSSSFEQVMLTFFITANWTDIFDQHWGAIFQWQREVRRNAVGNFEAEEAEVSFWREYKRLSDRDENEDGTPD